MVIDLQPRPSARRIPLPTECCGSAQWIPGDRFAYFSGGGRVLIYTSTLRRVGAISGWTAGDGVVIGRTMYGVTAGGALIRADLSSGKVRVIRRLPGKPSVIASASR